MRVWGAEEGGDGNGKGRNVRVWWDRGLRGLKGLMGRGLKVLVSILAGSSKGSSFN